MFYENVDDLGGSVVLVEDGASVLTKHITEERLRFLLDELARRKIPVVSLSLDESKLTKCAITDIVAACKESLKSLDLSDNNLHDDDVQEIKKLSRLEELCLDYNFLTDDVKNSLRQSLPNLKFVSMEPSPFAQDQDLSKKDSPSVISESPEHATPSGRDATSKIYTPSFNRDKKRKLPEKQSILGRFIKKI